MLIIFDTQGWSTKRVQRIQNSHHSAWEYNDDEQKIMIIIMMIRWWWKKQWWSWLVNQKSSDLFWTDRIDRKSSICFLSWWKIFFHSMTISFVPRIIINHFSFSTELNFSKYILFFRTWLSFNKQYIRCETIIKIEILLLIRGSFCIRLVIENIGKSSKVSA